MPRALRFTCLVGLVCALWSAAGCGPSGGTVAKPSEPVRKLLSDDGVRVLQTAVRVEAYRVESPLVARADDGVFPAEPPPATVPSKVGGFRVLARGADRDADFARRLAAVLLDDGTYSFDSAKGCIFDPGVAFRVVGGDGRTADVVLCFKCRELKVIVAAAAGGDGKPHQGYEDFDNANAALVRLAKEAFPDDPAIAGL